jgi:hypothetical protein
VVGYGGGDYWPYSVSGVWERCLFSIEHGYPLEAEHLSRIVRADNK